MHPQRLRTCSSTLHVVQRQESIHIHRHNPRAVQMKVCSVAGGCVRGEDVRFVIVSGDADQLRPGPVPSDGAHIGRVPSQQHTWHAWVEAEDLNEPSRHVESVEVEGVGAPSKQ
eukprot:3198552-Rhodomonas_salina.2